MPRAPAILGVLALDARSRTPLHRQLYDELRRAILDGRLKPEIRLPATRVLARELGISRNTVIAAFEQLTAEGYLSARVGSGTRVAKLAPETFLQAAARLKRSAPGAATRPRLAARGLALASVKRTAASGRAAFRPGLPARAEFPFDVWARLLARRARYPRADGFGYAHTAGLPALREALASYLGTARAVRCTREQVLVVAGSQAALDLAARMLLDPGDAAWIEEPGYLGARGALVGAGARLVPVPVDADGIDVAAGSRLCPTPRLVYITPSCQFPTGAAMSLPRRLALLEHARRSGTWIVEDDYDSEYRYSGRPLASLQGLDEDGLVLYVGSFAKTMFPALRAGYLVVPEALVEPFQTAIRLTGHSVPTAVQAALADFLADGYFAAHLRRMRVLYAERQAILVAAAKRRLDGLLEVAPAAAGMQIAADLVPPLDDREVARSAEVLGVVAPPLSGYFIGPPKRRGLHLGYAGVPEREIAPGVDVLARAIESAGGRAARAGRRGRGGKR